EALIGGSTAFLEAGETLSVRHLMTGLLVASGNDASITLAVGLAGSQEAFVELMNERARTLGLRDTAFENPHGLDGPGHRTTVRDLAILSRAAMGIPLFRELVAVRRDTIPGPGGSGIRTLESNNLLLDAYPEADGIKTGMTNLAGYTLVAHARRPALGVDLYVAMIGASSSEGRARDAEALLRWGFGQYARPMLLPPGSVVGEVPVQYRPDEGVMYRVERGVRPPIRLGVPVTEEIAAPLEVAGPVREGDVLGTVTFRQGERVLARRDLIAAESVDSAGLLDRVRSGIGALL
ncbi:MAG: D-alanyl-D-alanine carboxypeptidase family protein, partial [Miltoncostaeaceae bacterium]